MINSAYHVLRNTCRPPKYLFVYRYEALVRGQMEYAAKYREKIYIFETEQKREKFLRCWIMFFLE